MSLLSLILDINGLLILFLGFVTAYIYMTRNFLYWKKRQVKELQPCAFFGNFAQCLLTRKSPESFMSDLYEAGKNEQFIGYYILDEPHLMVRDPEMIKHVLVKDFDHFAERLVGSSHNDQIGNTNMFLVKGPEWRIIRQTMSKYFTSGKMKKVFDRMSTIADDIDKYLVANGFNDGGKVIDVTEMCYRITTDLIGVTVFGMNHDALKDPKSPFRKHGSYIFRNTYRRHFEFLSMFFYPRLSNLFGVKFFTNTSSRFLKKVFLESLDQRIKSGSAKADFIDLLTDLKNDEIATLKHKYNFSDEELAAQASIFYSAGLGTTGVTLMFCLYELAKNPDLQKKLRDEIRSAMDEADGKLTYNMVANLPYLDAVVWETLRIYPTVTFLDRVATDKYQFPGTNLTIEKGTPLRALQMDPKYFPNPEVFDPERFSEKNKPHINKYTYFPFGDGQHICIGMRLGLMVTKFGLSSIISKYAVEMCEKTTMPMEFSIFSIFLSSKSSIMLNMKSVDYN